MRLFIAVPLITVVCMLASCASMMVGDIRVYGVALHRVTLADIQAAINADQVQPKHNTPHDEPISQVDVVSTDEIDIYHGDRPEGVWFHCVIKRIGGKWRYAGDILYTS